MSTEVETVTGRTLIDPGLFDRITRRIAHDEDINQQLAARILDQALAFLGTCATTPGARLSPSGLVDKGWHTLILYTREYADLCDRLAGRFLHHNPDDQPDAVKGATIATTVQAIKTAGYTVDEELWTMSANCSEGSGGDGSDTSGGGNCSQCHQGCHNSN
jgi:hypothetical protein